MTPGKSAAPSAFAVALALGSVYLVWGSTYLAMRFALEDQTPLVARTVVGGTKYSEKSFSLFKTSTPTVMLTALKVAEDGMARGIVARVWNSAKADTTFSFSGNLLATDELTHVESLKGAAPPTILLRNQETATYLMR